MALHVSSKDKALPVDLATQIPEITIRSWSNGYSSKMLRIHGASRDAKNMERLKSKVESWYEGGVEDAVQSRAFSPTLVRIGSFLSVNAVLSCRNKRNLEQASRQKERLRKCAQAQSGRKTSAERIERRSHMAKGTRIASSRWTPLTPCSISQGPYFDNVVEGGEKVVQSRSGRIMSSPSTMPFVSSLPSPAVTRESSCSPLTETTRLNKALASPSLTSSSPALRRSSRIRAMKSC